MSDLGELIEHAVELRVLREYYDASLPPDILRTPPPPSPKTRRAETDTP